MSSNEFAQGIIEVLLSWVKWVTSWVWSFFQADMAGGFINWFAAHWLGLAVTLIIFGLVLDWIIWMIRWRPYWLWLRKRQVIYEDVPDDAPPKPRRPRRPEPRRHMPKAYRTDYEDPFAVGEVDPYALSQGSRPSSDEDEGWDIVWDSDDDPYAGQNAAPAHNTKPRS